MLIRWAIFLHFIVGLVVTSDLMRRSCQDHSTETQFQNWDKTAIEQMTWTDQELRYR